MNKAQTFTVSGVPASTVRIDYRVAEIGQTWRAYASPWSYQVPLHLFLDGSYTVVATAYDATNAVIESSASVAFSIVNVRSGITLSGLSGSLSGFLSVTPTLDYLGSAPNPYCSLDGIPLATSPSNSSITMDIATAFNGTANTVTFAGHGLNTGDLFTPGTTGSVTMPSGLATSSNYYVIVVDADTFKLASTFANSQSGTAIDFGTNGSGTLNNNQWPEYQVQVQPRVGFSPILVRSARVPNGSHTFWCGTYTTSSPSSVTEALTSADPSTDTLVLSGHHVATGRPVTFTTTGTLPAPLQLATTYYAIYTSSTAFKVAASQSEAEVGAGIDLTDAGSGTHTVAYTYETQMYIRTPAASPVINQRGTRALAQSYNVIDIQNGHAPMQLVPNVQNVFMTTSDNPTLSAVLHYTDGASPLSIAASSLTFRVISGTNVSVNASTGAITATGTGDSTVRMIYNVSTEWFRADVLVHVVSSLAIPHFSRAGAVRTTYAASQSFFPTPFFILDPNTINYSQKPTTYLPRAGVNAMTYGLSATALRYWPGSYSAFVSSYEAAKSVYPTGTASSAYLQTLASVPGADDWLQSPAMLAPALSNPEQSNAITYVATDIRNGGSTPFISMKDEITFVWQGYPTWDGRPGAPGGAFGTMTVTGCDSPPCLGTATVQATGWFGTRTNTGSNSRSAFCAYGSATAALNACYTVTASTANDFSFSTVNVPNGTYDYNSDPGLQLSAHYNTYTFTTWGIASVTSVVVSGGNTIVVNKSSHGMVTNQWVAFRGFPDSNLNDSYQITSTTSGSFTLTVPSVKPALSNTTYNSGNASGAAINPMIYPAFPNDAMAQLKTLMGGGTNPALTYPPAGLSSCLVYQNWGGFGGGNDIYIGGEDSVARSWPFDQGSIFDMSYRAVYTKLFKEFGCYNASTPKVFQLPSAGGSWWRRNGTTNLSMDYSIDAYCYAPTLRPEQMTAQAGLALSSGVVGWRWYNYLYLGAELSMGTNWGAWGASQNTCESTQNFVRPGNQTPSVQPHWQGVGLVNLLSQRLLPLLAQEYRSSPGAEQGMTLGVRTGSNGTLIIATNTLERAQILGVDLTGYATGGVITRYRLTPDNIAVADVSNLSAESSLSINPGETVFWAIWSTSTPSPLRTVQFGTYIGGPISGAVVRYSYHDTDLKKYGGYASCNSGVCSFQFDPALISSSLWAEVFPLNSSGAVIGRSGVMQIN